MNQSFQIDGQSLTAFPIERSGYPYIYASGFATLVFALIGRTWPAILGMTITFFICFFFRDPDRVIPEKQGVVVSPADGRIVSAGIIKSTPFMEGPCMKIGIFMSLFNAHINRVPYSGVIKKISYHPGSFLPANRDAASIQNEYNAVILEFSQNKSLCFVQIAGIVARRIICRIREGDNVTRGQKFGLICFGSRVDLYLPADASMLVQVGDKVKAGTSVLGVMPLTDQNQSKKQTS